VSLVNLLGRRVATLHDGPLEAGGHHLHLSAGGLASGTYLLRVSTPAGSAARRITLVR
jgi:hypothetical protein